MATAQHSIREHTTEEVDSVTLHLSGDEARLIYVLTSCIPGDGPVRKAADSISEALGGVFKTSTLDDEYMIIRYFLTINQLVVRL